MRNIHIPKHSTESFCPWTQEKEQTAVCHCWLLSEENPSREKDRERFGYWGRESGVLLARYAVWTSRVVESGVLTLPFLQLVSRLPHHKAVQALQVPAAMVLVTLLPRPEHDQGGVPSNLNKEGRTASGAYFIFSSLCRLSKPLHFYAARKILSAPSWSESRLSTKLNGNTVMILRYVADHGQIKFPFDKKKRRYFSL